jgi:hypothetical protein
MFQKTRRRVLNVDSWRHCWFIWRFFLFSFLPPVLGLELRAYILSHSQPFFVMGFFKIWSQELFAQAGFELRSSWSLPLE